MSNNGIPQAVSNIQRSSFQEDVVEEETDNTPAQSA